MSKVTIDQLTDVLVKRIALSVGTKSESGGDSCTPTIRVSMTRRYSNAGPPVLYTELRYDVDKNLSARILRKVFKGLEEVDPLTKTQNDKFRSHTGLYRFVPSRPSDVKSKSGAKAKATAERKSAKPAAAAASVAEKSPRILSGSINIRVWRSSVDGSINFTVSYA